MNQPYLIHTPTAPLTAKLATTGPNHTFKEASRVVIELYIQQKHRFEIFELDRPYTLLELAKHITVTLNKLVTHTRFEYIKTKGIDQSAVIRGYQSKGKHVYTRLCELAVLPPLKRPRYSRYSRPTSQGQPLTRKRLGNIV